MKGTLSYASARFAERMVTFFILPVLTKTITPLEYAVWTQSIIVAGVLMPVILLKFETTLVQFFPNWNNQNKKQNSVILFMLILIFAIFLLFTISALIFDEKLAHLIFGSPKLSFYIPLVIGLLLSELLFEFLIALLRISNRISKISIYILMKGIWRIGILILILIGIKSTFYFVCGNSNKKLDPEYSIFDKPIISLMKRISERGHYIGLHPSYDSFENKEMIKKELVSLKEICDKENIKFRYQTRMHFLRWNQSKTLRILNDIGVKIDSSMGYADKVGFRAGTSFEYPAFDVLNNELLDIRIKPLIAMEVSMFSKKYMNLNNDKVLEVTKLLRDNCKRFGGKFSLLWHNNNLSNQIEKNLYSQIITERFKDA